jgi:phenylpropionate dioxygenase-like ring-hydroxylating dioxygenase large terminal subunit
VGVGCETPSSDLNPSKPVRMSIFGTPRCIYRQHR